MNSFKNLAILILGFSLLQATLASSHCYIQLYKNSLNDADQDHLYQMQFGEIQPYYNAPFDGMNGNLYDENLEERSVSSFRVMVVGLDECGPCNVVGYSRKDLSGRSFEQYVEWGSDGVVNFDFCVKSFTLDCESNRVEEEEYEEEEEEEEEQQDE